MAVSHMHSKNTQYNPYFIDRWIRQNSSILEEIITIMSCTVAAELNSRECFNKYPLESPIRLLETTFTTNR